MCQPRDFWWREANAHTLNWQLQQSISPCRHFREKLQPETSLEKAKRVMTEMESRPGMCLVPRETYSLNGACCSALQDMWSYELVFLSHLPSHGACHRVNSNWTRYRNVICVHYWFEGSSVSVNVINTLLFHQSIPALFVNFIQLIYIKKFSSIDKV